MAITDLTDMFTKITAAIATLTAIKAETAAAILEAADTLGVKTFTSNQGNVTVGQSTDTIEVTDPLALAQSLPEDQRMTVPVPWAQAAAAKRLAIVGADAVDPDTGEVVPWARVKPASAPYLSWPSSAQQKTAKAEMDAAMRASIDRVLNPGLAVESGS